MLPAVADKIDRMGSDGRKKERKSSKKSKKTSKKSKKAKKSKKKRTKSTSSESDSSSEEERLTKSKRKTRKRIDDSESESTSSSDSESAGEWVEKSHPIESKSKPKAQPDDWMGGMMLPTYSKNAIQAKTSNKKDERKDIDSYDPSKSVRELNPYWKNGGEGLPTFQKPANDSDDSDGYAGNSKGLHGRQSSHKSAKYSNWRKKTESDSLSTKSQEKASSTSESSRSPSPESTREPPAQSNRSEFLTDQQMNELGAKILKAEIMGNDEMVDELRAKLERARQYRIENKEKILATNSEKRQNLNSAKSKHAAGQDEVLLTSMNSKGMSRPVTTGYSENDLWGGKSSRKRKQNKVETHSGGERVRYFADDDKHDIKQMVNDQYFAQCFMLTISNLFFAFQFEKEKFTTAAEHDREFASIAGKYKNPNDDLEDLFAENVCKQVDDKNLDRKERDRAIREHQKLARTLDTCDLCFDSPNMKKQQIVAMGSHVYLSLPWHEGLQTGQCIIAPLAHVACVTQLDEDVWAEIREFMKAIARMFAARKMDVIFFESARNLHRRPHLQVHAVPGSFEMAPFYFKKAIQEAEGEWTTNKQLINLTERDVRRAIPKGLPYFWVNFGMQSGFAHVIEDQERFPSNFAQEVIGGLLNLDPRYWRRPRKVLNIIPKVKQFADWWKPYDITK